MTDVTNVLVKSALDFLYSEYPDFLFYANRANLEETMQNALDNALPNDFTLQSSKPDFEAIVLQMVQELQADPVWKDILPAATGQTLLRNMSAGIAMLHNAIVRSTQVTFLKPGTPKSSVYAMMQSLGVNPRRKVPGRIDVQINVPDHSGVYVIPKWTQFTIQGVHFFNRRDIVYTEFELYKNLTLYQGTLFSQDGIASGINYETIEIGYENYNISNDDVYVKINGEEWTVSKTFIWNSPKRSKTFTVTTLETGNIEIKFGNDAYGKKLTNGDTIELFWFETLGLGVPTIPAQTTFDTILTSGARLTCQTLGGVYGADNELDKEFYINTGPFLRSSEHGAVTRGQYPDVACKYPRIKDALMRGQAELNPGKRNWMNIVQATVLRADGIPLTTQEWNDFSTYMVNNSVAQLEFIRRDPFIIPVDITAKVYCSNQSILNEVKALLEEKMKGLSTPRRGIIGFSQHRSDGIGILEGNMEDLTDEQELIAASIEYVTDYDVTYSAGFDPTTLPAGAGIDDQDGVVADFYSYVKINNVTVVTEYTPRRSFSGRRDLNIGITS